MSELLPCPLCGHLRQRPSTRTKFKCKGCTEWLELSKDFSQLQSYIARKEAVKASKDGWWHQQALIRQRKLGTDYDTARALVLAEHNANTQKMRDEARLAKLFPQETIPPPKPQPYNNNTKPFAAMSTTSDDDPDSPF
jgi:hypothetical protein